MEISLDLEKKRIQNYLKKKHFFLISKKKIKKIFY